MFTILARKILRNRTAFLVGLFLCTAFMIFQAKDARISYKFSRLLPTTDSTQVIYDNFQKTFKQSGNTIVLAVEDYDVFAEGNFEKWHKFESDIAAIDGVESVLSPTQTFHLERNDSLEQLELFPFPGAYTNVDLDSLKSEFYKMPFYEGLLYSKDRSATLLLVQIDPEVLYIKKVLYLVEDLKKKVKNFEKDNNLVIHSSGLPFIRMANTRKTSREIFMFIGLSLFVTSLLLYLFLRSFKAMLISLLVVVLGVCWSFGLITTFGFRITMLTSLVPSLIIVIGVPNCIFLINKYHAEFKEHGNRVLSVQRVIRRIGAATLLTNTTTALGFAALTLTDSVILKEFGIVAAINILMVFAISIIIIPIFYSFSKLPKQRHYQHLEKKWVNSFIQTLTFLVENKRKHVYFTALIFVVVAIYGTSKMYTTGSMAEEVQENDPLKIDLRYFEQKFGGVVPLEILVDTKKRNGVQRLSTLKRMDKLQSELSKFPELSRPVSIVDPIKFIKQAYFRGDSSFYDLPNSQEKNFIFKYIPQEETQRDIITSLVDTTGGIARITVQVKDLGTDESHILQEKIRAKIDSIFEPDRYDVTITGASVVFLKGTDYLIKNLVLSLLIAIMVIAFIMALLFRSFAMVLVSLLPNLFPLLITAGIMGFAGIPLKPSTILVFSIAFGISVDDTIHFLAKYRLELRYSNWNIKQSIKNALHETGVSMFYTSIILFFGFSVFIASSFGGIVSLGILVSVTLIVAMVSNLILLPTLLMSLEKLVANKDFDRPLIRIYKDKNDEENDDEE
tara:strand:- start:20491 stop:22854 length:2364 start_codon:yes stop_codon:yes gene_type:complete